MPGHSRSGPPPKNPGKRARPNKDGGPGPRFIDFRDTKPDVELPDIYDWHDMTRLWWRHWVESPLTDECSSADWDYLLETAFIHTAFWQTGRVQYAAELRQRVGLFGATPADRARLRIFLADADERDDKAKARAKKKADEDIAKTYGDLRAVG